MHIFQVHFSSLSIKTMVLCLYQFTYLTNTPCTNRVHIYQYLFHIPQLLNLSQGLSSRWQVRTLNTDLCFSPSLQQLPKVVVCPHKYSALFSNRQLPIWVVSTLEDSYSQYPSPTNIDLSKAVMNVVVGTYKGPGKFSNCLPILGMVGTSDSSNSQ